MDGQCRREMDQLLSELQQLLVGISIMQDLTLRARDSLVSFGERLSTRLFAAFLRAEVRAQLWRPLTAFEGTSDQGPGIFWVSLGSGCPQTIFAFPALLQVE